MEVREGDKEAMLYYGLIVAHPKGDKIDMLKFFPTKNQLVMFDIA
ncbi:hypothetical protein [Thorsellia anophelis]|nr:hypothetical protein [Thorsellia anophelis]